MHRFPWYRESSSRSRADDVIRVWLRYRAKGQNAAKKKKKNEFLRIAGGLGTKTNLTTLQELEFEV
jgi:hypothetical protein